LVHDGARQETVTSSDGCTIGVITEGTGPPILLVHGGMRDSTGWAALWPLLIDHYTVTTMDRRGRGMSGDGPDYRADQEYRDVHAVVSHLATAEPEGIDVFGHSIGAVFALGATANGARVRRLVLAEPPGPSTLTREWVDRATALLAAGQAGRVMAEFLVRIIGLDRSTVTALRESPLARDALPIVEATMVREAEFLLDLDLDDLTRGVTAPVRFLLGDRSPRWASTVTRILQQGLSAASLAVLPDCGHDAVDDAPHLVAEHLDSFLGSTPPCS